MTHTRWFLTQLGKLALTIAGVFGLIVLMALISPERFPRAF